MSIKLILFSLFIITITNSFCQDKISWISSTNENRWVEESPMKIVKKLNKSTSTIVIFSADKEQLIDGFGGCFNELGWDVLKLLDYQKRESILSDFFDPQLGFRFNICRMPIGANDYARDWYSLDDSVGDYEMKYFNINRDKENLIPYIKQAMKYNPSLKVWASPWCPPAWMKQNNHYACISGENNGLDPSKQGREGLNQINYDEKTLSAYALYFSKFVKAYRSEGIDLYAVHVQNEFNSCQNFPSCVWTASALSGFIGKYLGPKLASEGLNTEIWFGTIERPYVQNIDTMLTSIESSKYVKGLGFQWAGKGCVKEAHLKYPLIKLMETESECGNGSNDWKAAEYTFSLMKLYFEAGVNSYMYWNMVLDESGKSRWGWKQNSLISVDSKTKAVTYNPEFYLIKHFSHFINPGAFKLKITGEIDHALAFLNPDKSIVLLIYNPSAEMQSFSFQVNNNCFDCILKPRSFNTFKL